MATLTPADYLTWVESTASTTAAAWLAHDSDAGSVRLTLRRSHRDVINNKTRTTLQHVVIPMNGGAALSLPPQNDSAGASVINFSPSGNYFVTIRKEVPPGAAAGAGRNIFEVFSAQHSCAPLATIHVDARVHGDVNTDAAFGLASGTCAWSHDERYIAYVAEARGTDTSSHFDDLVVTATAATPAAGSAAGGKLVGSQFDFNAPGGVAGVSSPRETWGERYDSVRCPRLFLLDLECQRVHMLAGVPDDVSVGRPCWLPGSAAQPYLLAYCSWPQTPRRMGITYCTHRQSAVMCVDVTPQLRSEGSLLRHVLLTPSHMCARFPRLCGDALLYLSMPLGVGQRVHAYRSDVFSLPLAAVTAQMADGGDAPPLQPTQLETVRVPLRSRATGGDVAPFHGVYAADFADAVGDAVYFNCAMGAYAMPVCMRVVDGAAHLIAEDGASPLGTDATLVAVRAAPTAKYPAAHVLAIVTSSPTTPERVAVVLCTDPATPGSYLQLWSAPLNAVDCTADVVDAPRWLLPHARVREALAQLRLAHIPIACTHPEGVCEVMLLYPRGASAARVCMVPHGGPHASFTHSYMHSYAFMASRGYAVAMINYSGSYAYGDAAMDACVGSIGVNDVWECVEATRATLAVCGARELLDAERPGLWASHYAPHAVADIAIDAARVFVCGGSHGGFLGMHLVVARPDLVAAASLRNPVCDLVAMHAMTDIPDWCVVESLGAAAWDRVANPHSPVLTSDMLPRMAAVSPVHSPRFKHVRAAVLIALGLKDRRVVPYDGMNTHHMLKAVGVPTKLLVYPEDNHALDKPATEADFWMNTLAWFAEHDQVGSPEKPGYPEASAV